MISIYRVLLVDDEPIFLEYMKQVINWQDYDCHIVACKANGEDAYQYIVNHQPEIVFMDINIPKRSGLDVCREIRSLNIPCRIIIMTAHDAFEFAYRAIKLNIDDYLLKPFDQGELASTLVRSIELLKHQSNNRGKLENKETRKSLRLPPDLADKIGEYLLNNYADSELTLEKIAQDLNFESSHLRRTYKKKKGLTITKRLEAIRIDKAKELLREGQCSGAEVAFRTGFSNRYYFSTKFKQVCGCTPSEYKSCWMDTLQNRNE